MATPLVMSREAVAAIRVVRGYAETRVFSMQDIFAAMQTGYRIGDDPHFRVEIPMGFICCYSVEMQEIGKCRHLSISVAREGRVVHPDAARLLAEEFGFRGGLNDYNLVWMEDLPDGRKAVNLLQLFDPPIPTPQTL